MASLGHINLNRIKRLIKFGALHSLVLEDLVAFESCIKGKMTKKPFTSKGIKAEKCLELLHIDVCRLFNVQACEGNEYFITFTNYYSLFGYVYLMHRKSDGLDKFKEFKAELENQLSKHLKALRSVEVDSTCQMG